MEDSLSRQQLLDQLRLIIARLWEDLEARSDPVLEEIARALDVVVELIADTPTSGIPTSGTDTTNT
jgi:hypothetical protein